jgi:hypothetical protein
VIRRSRRNAVAAIALIAVAAIHLASVPRTIWEFDESYFAYGVERYEPLQHHPPPPGYPLYMGFAKGVAKLLPGDSFTALLATSIAALLAGLAAWFFAFRELSDERTAVVATVLLYACPALLISGTLPQSDSGALALFGLAVFACARMLPGRWPVAGGRWPVREIVFASLACAAAIGWRLQFSIVIVPMFLVALLLLRTWRARFIAIGVFGVACLAWFVPLVIAAGGPSSYWQWLSGQAAYYAAHDADLSRSGHSMSHIALRFIAHPWGPKWLSLPLLMCALYGVRRPQSPLFLRAERRRDPDASESGDCGHRTPYPLLAGCLVYLAFALWSMDPADAVRYAIPSLPIVALFAARGISRMPAVAILYVIGAYGYASPVLRERATTPSPPAAAATWIEAIAPKETIVLFDMTLAPQASYLLREYKTMRIDAGLAQYGGSAIPMLIYADGERGSAEGVTFHWPDTDAYRKLTRQHYGAVSVIELPLSQRYRVIEGVHAPERRRDGRAWRWLGSRGVVELPQRRGSHVRVTLRTPPEYPLDANRVNVNGTVVEIRRNQTVDVVVPFAERIVITADRTFVPARIPGANNRDARTLSVMLTSVEQLDAPPAGG